MIRVLLLFLFTGLPIIALPQSPETIPLWPGQVPGEKDPKHAPVETQDTSGKVTRVTDVTDPAIIVYQPDRTLRNGAGIIVCPGGGYNVLAIDKEGVEIAAWLTRIGYTAFVLQYRVPQKQEGALQDVQRAIRLARSRAANWSLESGQIGVLGFSAGGSLCARAGTRFNEKTYPRVDQADDLSCRPDFAVLIYPAYLDQGENRSLTPELTVSADTPDMFIFVTAEDPHGNSSLVMAAALRDAGVPVELHMLPFGKHGYGMRPGTDAAKTWPALAEKWMNKFLIN